MKRKSNLSRYSCHSLYVRGIERRIRTTAIVNSISRRLHKLPELNHDNTIGGQGTRNLKR